MEDDLTFHNKYYNAFSDFILRKYGERVQKVTVDAGFTCPNRDGTLGSGGCIYCNNDSFNPGYNNRAKSIRQQISEGIDFLQQRYKVKKFLVYFQPFSNTYGPLHLLQACYEEALSCPDVVGLTIGTRPDCIDEQKLDYLSGLAKRYDITLEYGLESIYAETLLKINRGHDFQSYLRAVTMARDRGIQVCTHIIIGFPWENREHWLHEAEVLSAVPTNFLKIHHLHIVQDTELGRRYQQQPFELLSYPQYLEVICSFLEKLNPDIVIQRLFGESPAGLLLAPVWNRSRNEMLQDIRDEFKRRGSRQGKMFYNPGGTGDSG
jgi:uncharacterized protein